MYILIVFCENKPTMYMLFIYCFFTSYIVNTFLMKLTNFFRYRNMPLY